MITREHLTTEKIAALKGGALSRQETILTLEHIGECGQCADAFAGSYGKSELLELPQGFRSDIFSAIGREKRELFRYGFKVSIAACITLFLLFSGTFSYSMNVSKNIYPDFSGVNEITENLKGFSDKLIHFEITKDLKEEL